MLHFSQVWPIAARQAAETLDGRRIICVEGNQTGQFASVLREAGLIGKCDLLLRYDGLPFTGEEIAERTRMLQCV